MGCASVRWAGLHVLPQQPAFTVTKPPVSHTSAANQKNKKRETVLLDTRLHVLELCRPIRSLRSYFVFYVRFRYRGDLVLKLQFSVTANYLNCGRCKTF
uniref:Uncharacterized protein n=1 Tax=Anguilla anguilla TaxID=7936 RepID=A0A0E9X1N1_ANGAN